MARLGPEWWPGIAGIRKARFVALVEHIRAHGYAGWFYAKPITYLDDRGCVYWTMGEPLAETTIINRCLKADSYEERQRNGALPENQRSGQQEP